MMNINEIVELSAAFSAEVNVARDFKKDLKKAKPYLDGYLPNSSSRNIIKKIISSLSSRETRKVHLITASYGTGKSYLLLILAYLLANSDSEAFDVLKSKIADKEQNHRDGLFAALKEYWSQPGPYLVVIPSYGTEDFGQAMLIALNEALAATNLPFRPKTHYLRAADVVETWRMNNTSLYQKFESKIYNKSGEDYIRLLKNCDGSAYETFKVLFMELVGSEFSEMHGDVYQAFADTARYIANEGYKGIVVLHDEFSGVLDKMINKISQTASLNIQEFLEQVKRKENNANIVFVAASHQDPSTILADKQQNIDKINGRFEKHSLEIGESEGEELMAKVFITRDPAQKAQALSPETIEELVDETLALGLYADKEENWLRDLIVRSLYPLHPLTAFVLPRLSGQFAQNTRSMFNFLSPDEIRNGSLQKYLDVSAVYGRDEQLNLFTPDMLLDFFEQNLSDSRSENVALQVDAYRTTLGRRNEPEVKRVLQNILILTATREPLVNPNFEVMCWANYTMHTSDLQELMDQLVRDEVLELNQNGVYEFPQLGSRNLSKILAEERSKIGTLTINNSKSLWAAINGPSAYPFEEHNERYGSNRAFLTLWITSPDDLDEHLEALAKSYRWENKDGHKQGYIAHLLTRDELDLDPYKQKAEKYKDILKYVVFAQPKTTQVFDRLLERTVDYIAYERALKNTEVTGNSNHLQRVKSELNRLHTELGTLVKRLFEPENWLWGFASVDDKIEIKNIRALDNRMNEFIDELFTDVPKVKDDALWFNKSRSDVKTALAEILTAEDKRIPLINHNNNSPTTRIISNFFNHTRITSNERTINKVHYGEIKEPEAGTPAEKIFKLFEKTLKANPLTPPAQFVKPLLQAPFGLSDTLIKFFFTCYLRANTENLLIVDSRRQGHPLEKDPVNVEELFKPSGTLQIRKIEMSTLEIQYLKQLNALFNKDYYASDFGELSKRFAGLMDFVSPLQESLIRENGEAEVFYFDELKPFLQRAADPTLNREKVAREFFMVTLPGLLLSIGSKEEFENDPENIPAIIAKIKHLKDYPVAKEAAFKKEVIGTLSKSVFGESIATLEEFRIVVKKWFDALSYTSRSISAFEDSYITSWLQKLRDNEQVDIAKFYLDELSYPPVREWTNLNFERLSYQDRIQKYKTDIENFKRSPISVYQRIARSCFEQSATECPTEAVFAASFKNWWATLPELSKATHYDDPFTNAFITEYQQNAPTKECFLRYIPIKWIAAGFEGLSDSEWENWGQLEVSVIAEQYAMIKSTIDDWRPPVAESALCIAVSAAFSLEKTEHFELLNKVLFEDWYLKLPPNTQKAQWPSGSTEETLMAAIRSAQTRNCFIQTLPTAFGLREFKYWNNDILTQFNRQLSDIIALIESYQRPFMEVVIDLEARFKKKSSSINDFRIQLKDAISLTDAYCSNAEKESGLLSDPRANPFLQQIRVLTSAEYFPEFIKIIAAAFNIDTPYSDWNSQEQSAFVKQFTEVYNHVQKWKYPLDTSMEDARKKLKAEIETVKLDFGLSSSQLLKILTDLIEQNSATPL